MVGAGGGWDLGANSFMAAFASLESLVWLYLMKSREEVFRWSSYMVRTVWISTGSLSRKACRNSAESREMAWSGGV